MLLVQVGAMIDGRVVGGDVDEGAMHGDDVWRATSFGAAAYGTVCLGPPSHPF